LALLSGHQAALLGQLELGAGAGLLAGFDQAQHRLGVAQVELGYTQLFFESQALQVSVGDAAEQGQLHGLAVQAAGVEAAQGAVAGTAQAAPEIDFVAGAEVGIERGAGALTAAGIELIVALAAQQALAAGIQAELHLRQQRRAGDYRPRLGLAYPGCSCGQVLAVVSGNLDQLVKLWAGEGLPPALIRQCLCLARSRALPIGWRGDAHSLRRWRGAGEE